MTKKNKKIQQILAQPVKLEYTTVQCKNSRFLVSSLLRCLLDVHSGSSVVASSLEKVHFLGGREISLRWNGLGGWSRVDLRKFQSKEDIPDRQAAITRLYWRPALRNHFQTRLNFHIRPNHQTRPNFQTILNFRTKPSLRTRPNSQTRPIPNKTDQIFTQPSFQSYF